MVYERVGRDRSPNGRKTAASFLQTYRSWTDERAKGARRSPDGSGGFSMGNLTDLVLICGSAIVAILGNMIASEFYDRCPSWAARIISCAASKLRRLDQERYREEWLAHLGESTGNITKLMHATGCYVASIRLNNRHLPTWTKHKKRARRAMLSVNLVFFKNGHAFWVALARLVSHGLWYGFRKDFRDLGIDNRQLAAERGLEIMSKLISSYMSIRDLMRRSPA
jgi:hypothetical protein